MSDKDNKDSEEEEEENKISIDDLKEPLIFFGNENSKKHNHTGKSNLKKEKNSNKNCVKIIEPNPELQNLNEVVKERRKKRTQFKTVKEPIELKDKLLKMNLKETKLEEIKEENVISPTKFIRKNKRSITLMEKSRLAEKLLKEEMKLEVRQENLVIQEKGNPKKYYTPIKLLGQGSYGSVYEAQNIIFQNTVAMKIINKTDSKMDDKEILNEINILKKLSHPNIVKIFEFYITKAHYYIVTEFCKDGELFSYIKNKYSERQLAVLFYQIFSGLWYLHDNKMLHRDIKLENIMISGKEKDQSTGEELFWIKIIDFGTAKIFEKNKKEKDVVGSSYYIAPEVLKQNYNEKCDTWSVGVILYMALVGKAPFDGKNDDEIKFGGRSLFSNYKKEEVEPYINNLFNYSFNSKIQQLVIAFLVHNLPSSDSSIIILKLFRHFNTSGNCKLTKDELRQGLYEYREPEFVDNYVENLFLLLDGDNNGYIEYEEFLRACIDKKLILKKNYLKYAFKFLKQDDETETLNTQKIIKAFVVKPNIILEAVFNKTLNNVDKDGDGTINYQEFEELMLNYMK